VIAKKISAFLGRSYRVPEKETQYINFIVKDYPISSSSRFSGIFFLLAQIHNLGIIQNPNFEEDEEGESTKVNVMLTVLLVFGGMTIVITIVFCIVKRFMLEKPKVKFTRLPDVEMKEQKPGEPPDEEETTIVQGPSQKVERTIEMTDFAETSKIKEEQEEDEESRQGREIRKREKRRKREASSEKGSSLSKERKNKKEDDKEQEKLLSKRSPTKKPDKVE